MVNLTLIIDRDNIFIFIHQKMVEKKNTKTIKVKEKQTT